MGVACSIESLRGWGTADRQVVPVAVPSQDAKDVNP
jgi:hypothetical protein